MGTIAALRIVEFRYHIQPEGELFVRMPAPAEVVEVLGDRICDEMGEQALEAAVRTVVRARVGECPSNEPQERQEWLLKQRSIEEEIKDLLEFCHAKVLEKVPAEVERILNELNGLNGTNADANA